ncbi:MAG: hypothetical protein ACSLFD_05905 [Solirubrobacterales bacterium]
MLLAIAFTGPAAAAPGDLDQSFGTAGVSSPQFGSGTDQFPNSVVRQTDGKLVVAGYGSPGPKQLVTRYLENGALDSSFGTGGTVEGGSGSWDSVAIQDDGKILLAGRSGSNGLIARLNADGTPDSEFGTASSFTFNPTSLSDEMTEPGEGDTRRAEFRAMKELPDGRIRAIGTFYDCDLFYRGCNNTMLIALEADGTPEAPIAPGGAKALALDGAGLQALIQDDGSALVLRDRPSEPPYGANLSLRKIDAQGDPDYSYRGDWSQFYGGGNLAADGGAIATDSAGRTIVGAGSLLLRFKSDGELDESFRAFSHFPSVGDLTSYLPHFRSFNITGIAVDSSERILLSGGLEGAKDERNGKARRGTSGYAARLLPDGHPDPTFGGDGLSAGWKGPLIKTSTLGVAVPGAKVIPTGADTFAIAGIGPSASSFRFTLARFDSGNASRPKCQGKPVDFIGSNTADKIFSYGDVVSTGRGNDVVKTSGDSIICTGSGDDQVDVNYQNGLRANLGSGDDLFSGGPAADRVDGGSGEDHLLGKGWADRLDGGPGRDFLDGGGRDDQLFGGIGRDDLFGRSGLDRLFGGTGKDRLDPGPKGPRIDDFVKEAPGLSMRVSRIGKVRAEAAFNIQLKCAGEDETFPIQMDKIKVKPSGKFRFRSDPAWRNWQGGSIVMIEDIDGEFDGKRLSGRYRIKQADDSAYPGLTCWSGNSWEEPWVKFDLKAQPKPQQFARQSPVKNR